MLSDAFEEMLADNKRERKPTRARAYAGKVRFEEFTFDTLADYQKWRERGRRAIHSALERGDFLLWITGNHLGALPLYDELSAASKDTLVIQFDAHLDIYNLSDCTSELSHGNFLLHPEAPLPPIVNVGHRELLLRPEYIAKHFLQTFGGAELAIDPQPALNAVRRLSGEAGRVFLDLDCDVFDPAYFPGAAHPLPFGISPQLLLRFIDTVWSEKVAGLVVSEFDPARDQNDHSLATLMWLIEYVLLRRFEK